MTLSCKTTIPKLVPYIKTPLHPPLYDGLHNPSLFLLSSLTFFKLNFNVGTYNINQILTFCVFQLKNIDQQSTQSYSFSNLMKMSIGVSGNCYENTLTLKCLTSSWWVSGWWQHFHLYFIFYFEGHLQKNYPIYYNTWS